MADGITTPADTVDAMLAFIPKQSKLERAEAYLTKSPAAKNSEVAAAVGCSDGTVWLARQNLGILRIRRPRTRGPTHGGTKLARVTAYLRAHPDAATKDVVAALDTDDATVGRARKLVHRAPAAGGSDQARIAQHLRVMLEHSLKCFDPECADCLRAEGLVESEELGETGALARMVENAVVVQERATHLVDTLQTMRPGPERDRELSLQGVSFRKMLDASPSFADLPEELKSAARARLEPRARPELADETVVRLQLEEHVAALRARTRPDGKPPSTNAVVADLQEHVAALSQDNVRLRRLAGEIA